MNLSRLVEAVTSEIKRPDRNDQVIRAVRSTITQVHTAAAFPQDLVEDAIEVTPAHLLKFPLPARFRGFELIMPVDSSGKPLRVRTNSGYYEQVSSREMYTPGGSELVDVFYVAGASVVVRSSTAPQKLYMQYFQNPDISNPELETWAMELYPEMFIDGATAKVYKGLRQERVAQQYETRYREMLPEFIGQHIGV